MATVDIAAVEKQLREGAEGLSKDPRFAQLAISGADVADAFGRIQGLAHVTPVLTCRTLDERVFGGREGRIFFKCENLQRVGAFKFRGAVNAVTAMLADRDGEQPHIVTESSGNHGQAIALAAKLRGCQSTIVMPRDAPPAKIAAVEGYGGEVVLVDAVDRKSTSEKILAGKQGVLVHPSNEPLVMAGQGTVVAELWQQMRTQAAAELDVVVVAVGGGGLMSGSAVAAKTLNPNAIVVAAEPAAVNDAYRSWREGSLQGHPGGGVPASIASGLRSTLGSNTWPVLRELVDEVITVEEHEIAAAMHLVFVYMKQVVEPSAAVALAAMLKPEFQSVLDGAAGTNVGTVFTGGNVSVPEMAAIIAEYAPATSSRPEKAQ